MFIRTPQEMRARKSFALQLFKYCQMDRSIKEEYAVVIVAAVLFSIYFYDVLFLFARSSYIAVSYISTSLVARPP